MAQKNTLFSYFSPKPAAPKSSNSTPSGKGKSSPESDQDSKGKGKSPAASPKLKNSTNQEHEENGANSSISECEFKVGDIVWAKLEGYPFWPSIVCDHPTSKSHVKKVGKHLEIHVQFFEDPINRSWVKETYVKPYTGSECKDFQRGGQFYTTDPNCWKYAQQADKALKKDESERLKLIVELQPSSDEEESSEEEVEIEDINWDDDIFDAEMDEQDSSKENNDANKVGDVKEGSAKKSVKKKATTVRITRPKAKRRKVVVESNNEEDSLDSFIVDSDDVESSDYGDSGVDENEMSGSATEDQSPVKESKKKKVPTATLR